MRLLGARGGTTPALTVYTSQPRIGSTCGMLP